MKTTILLSALVLVAAPLTWSQSISISSSVFNAQNEAFKAHATYLTMEIPYAPVKKVYKDLINSTGTQLMGRGEAHITVITPPEYLNELSGFISMEEIDTIAKNLKIQEAEFSIVCLGSVEKIKNGIFTKAYYLVIESQPLLNVRRQILKTINGRGGSPTLFDPERFFPHITVGFVSDDLHESDGVYKDSSTCKTDIEIE